MQKYFISNNEMLNNSITNEDIHHIRNVMRFKTGDSIIVCDEVEEWLVRIIEISEKIVRFERVEMKRGNSELPFFVSIFQGYPKGDKLDEIIKHAAELGAAKVCPLITKRSLFKLDEKKKEAKLKRFNKIAKEACEQSNRSRLLVVPDIFYLSKFDFSDYDYLIVCYEESAKENEYSTFKCIIKNLTYNSKIAIVIGPEGGLDTSEIEDLESKGFKRVGLGPRILRTETVVFYCLSSISYEWELKFNEKD